MPARDADHGLEDERDAARAERVGQRLAHEVGDLALPVQVHAEVEVQEDVRRAVAEEPDARVAGLRQAGVVEAELAR